MSIVISVSTDFESVIFVCVLVPFVKGQIRVVNLSKWIVKYLI